MASSSTGGQSEPADGVESMQMDSAPSRAQKDVLAAAGGAAANMAGCKTAQLTQVLAMCMMLANRLDRCRVQAEAVGLHKLHPFMQP